MKLITVKEAAPMFGLTEQGLYSAIRSGQIPCVRIGKRIRVLESLAKNAFKNRPVALQPVQNSSTIAESLQESPAEKPATENGITQGSHTKGEIVSRENGKYQVRVYLGRGEMRKRITYAEHCSNFSIANRRLGELLTLRNKLRLQGVDAASIRHALQEDRKINGDPALRWRSFPAYARALSGHHGALQSAVIAYQDRSDHGPRPVVDEPRRPKWKERLRQWLLNILE